MGFSTKDRINVLIFASMIFVVFNCFAANLGLYNYRTSPALLVSAVVLSVFWGITYLKEREVLGLSYPILISIVFMGVAYGLAGIFFFVPTYIMNGYIFALQLPLFYSCIKHEHIRDLTKSYSIIYIAVSTVVIICCFLLAPLTGTQYQGIFNNPNLTGEFLSTLAVCTLYMYESTDAKKQRLLYLVVFGISVAFTLFTRSRSTMLAYALLAVIYLIYIIRMKRGIAKRIVAFAFAMLITTLLTFAILNNVTNNICELTGIRITEESFISDQNDINSGINSNVPIKESGGIASELEATTDRLFKGINDGSSFSSGRIQIWYTYLTNLSFKGHAPNHLTFYYDGQELQANSHNSFLHVSYQSGILSGIAFLVILVLMLFSSYRDMFKENITTESLFAMCVITNAIPYVILSNAIGPYTAFPLLAFWIIVIPFYSNKTCKNNVNNIKQFIIAFLGK